MALILVGLGLFNERDITVGGLDALNRAHVIYAEMYTNLWGGSLKTLEGWCEKEIILLPRSGLEEGAQKIIEEATGWDVAVCVPGDPLAATTHLHLVAQARKRGIQVRIVHASSIFSAVAECGLHLYKMGRTTTLAYPEGSYRPKSPYLVIADNKEAGLHTLVLLDVKADEGRYMTVTEGLSLLSEFESEERKGVCGPDSLVVGIARLGSDDAVIKAGTLKDLLKFDFGQPPHCLIIPGKLHFTEEEMLDSYK
ncbi:Diphthine synthase [uncultured archaeon]|nr:Diphthine synthase [uncultured archaeon]